MAWRKFLDAQRSTASRHDRERRIAAEPPQGPTECADDTLRLLFLCAHPTLAPSSAVALVLRAVGGLTTRQIAAAYLVPEATMAQRISRAKRPVRNVRLDEPGDLGTVLRVLYLAAVDPGLPRYAAASARLHEKAGDLARAARLYAEAAMSAPTLAERHHLTLQAARLAPFRRLAPNPDGVI